MISVKFRAVFLVAALILSGVDLCFAQSTGDATADGDDTSYLDAPVYPAPALTDQTVVQQVSVGGTSSKSKAKQTNSQASAPTPGAQPAAAAAAATKQPDAESANTQPPVGTANKQLAQKMIAPPVPLVRSSKHFPPVTSDELPPLPKPAPPVTKVTTTPLPGVLLQQRQTGEPKDTSLFADLSGRNPYRSGTAMLRARVVVPHNKTAIDTFTAYPYPVKPPLVKWPEPLSTKFQTVKDQILDSGYLNRQSGRKPHPTFGWRWVEAYQTGLRNAKIKAGMSVPHTIATHYPWASHMVKYVMPEVRRLNAVEDERQERYQKAIADYAEKRTDLEMEATRDGMYPMKMRRKNNFVSETGLPPGNWYIVGTHKVAGLTYYWNFPVQVQPGQVTNVVLTEANAMVIQGAW